MQALADAEQAREEAQQQHATAIEQVHESSSDSTTPNARATAGESGAVILERPLVAQAQKWLFLSVVIGGVIGVVSVIVFAAMTIASASSVAKQRQYR
jgi:hypothetical protein